MKVQKQEITVGVLLRRYAAEERDFTSVFISDLREGLIRGFDLSSINLENSSLDIDFSNAIFQTANLQYIISNSILRNFVEISKMPEILHFL